MNNKVLAEVGLKEPAESCWRTQTSGCESGGIHIDSRNGSLREL